MLLATGAETGFCHGWTKAFYQRVRQCWQVHAQAGYTVLHPGLDQGYAGTVVCNNIAQSCVTTSQGTGCRLPKVTDSELVVW